MGGPARAAVGLYLLAALSIVTLLPAYFVAEGAVAGFRLLPEALALTKEVAASVAFGLAAAACAYGVSGLKSAIGNRQSAIEIALCLPGLLGALVLALLILALLQAPVLRAAYDTPVPLLLALTLLLLPFALVLRMLVSATRPGEATHAARLLTGSLESKVARGGRRVLWHLKGQGKLAVAILLFCWGYFDLTASAILAPSQMTPVTWRLYNFMHYGHMAALSTMVLVCFLVPFLLCALFFASFRVFRG
jgi:ABC-type Fe3+ transport system permease subunit